MKEALQRLLPMLARKVAGTFSIPIGSIMAMIDEFVAALPADILKVSQIMLCQLRSLSITNEIEPCSLCSTKFVYLITLF